MSILLLRLAYRSVQLVDGTVEDRITRLLLSDVLLNLRSVLRRMGYKDEL
jgi:hypothetical protein